MFITLRTMLLLNLFKTQPPIPKFLHYSKVLWNVGMRYFIKDEYSGWQKSAEKKLEEIHSKDAIDVVISSFFPAASHVASYDFLKNKPEIFWVADMRDEMSFNLLNASSVKSYYLKAEGMDRSKG